MKFAGLLRMLAVVLLVDAAVFSTPSRAANEADKPESPPNVLDDRSLVKALRGGGYIIYFRHGITDLSTQDRDRADLANCKTQRRLSEAGRQQMIEIGWTLQELGIRASRVISSPYCRSMDTATLAFGKVEVDDNLRHTVTADQATAERQAVALRKLLATVPEEGMNIVLSGHTGNLQEATGIWPSPEGVAIIFKPDGKGGFSYIATIKPDHWKELLRLEKPAAR